MIARIDEGVTGASGRVIMASINERTTGFVHEGMDRCMDTDNPHNDVLMNVDEQMHADSPMKYLPCTCKPEHKEWHGEWLEYL